MIGKLKVISVAFVASMAISAMVVPSTHAGAILTGEQLTAEKHKFQITSAAAGPNIQCTQVHFEGTVAGEDPQITAGSASLTPRYTNCIFLGLAATITVNGCKYTLTGGQPSPTTALVDVAGCTAGKQIEVHVPGCTLTIPEQTGLGHITFENKAGLPEHVEAQSALTGIKYETHGAACTHQPETTLRSDGKYTGKTTFKAYEDLGSEKATHNGHEYSKLLAGPQDDLHVGEGELHAGSRTGTGAILTGEQLTAEKHKFQITSAAAGPNIQCTQVHFEGTVAGEDPQITAGSASLTPRYTNCIFLGLAATITVNGCKYTLTGGQPSPTTALVDVAGCTAGKQIEVHVPGCTLTIPEQTGLGHITFENKAGLPEHVEAQSALTGIKYETHGAACTHQPETTLRSDGKYTGKTTFKAYEDLGSEKATHNGHEYSKLLAGPQDDLHVGEGELHAGSRTGTGAILTGEQLTAEKHKFQITSAAAGPNIQCTQVHFEGTVAGEDPQITAGSASLTPRYTNCIFLGLAATITVNGCKYTLTGGQPSPTTALVDVAGCTAGKQIEVHVPGCTLTIPEQTGLGHITFENKAGLPEHVEAQSALTGIKYETHGAACTHQPETTLRSDGKYTGKTTFKAYEDLGSEKATHNGHEYSKLLAGPQDDLHVGEGELHAGSRTGTGAILTGEQLTAEKHKFQITSAAAGPNIQCTQVHFEGTVAGEDPQITAGSASLTPRYTNCIFLGLAATITVNGCKYTLTGGQPSPTTALVDVAGCTAGKQIEVHVPGCTLTIPEQTGLGHITFENKAGLPEHVEAQSTITGIKYETHGAACAHQPETSLKSDGKYTGKTTFKAYEDLGSEQASHNGHEYSKVLAGKQADLHVGEGELHAG